MHTTTATATAAAKFSKIVVGSRILKNTEA